MDEVDKIKEDNPEKIKYETKLDGITSVVCKLNSVLNGDIYLKEIIYQKVIKSNKIILEGIHLFTIYVLYIISQDEHMPITETTIRRCMRYCLTNPNSSRSTGDIDEDDIIQHVKKIYFDFDIIGREDDFFDDSQGLMKGIEATADTYHTNLIMHIRTNFKRFQKRYLRHRLTKFLENYKDVENDAITFLLPALQQMINGNHKYSYRTEERRVRFNTLVIKYDLDSFGLIETLLLKEFIPFSINFADELPKVTDKEIYNYLSYFSYILKEFKEHDLKRFKLVPHFVPKIRYITFDARPLCAIYNSWKQTDINVKIFEKDYEKYFNEMFHIKKKYKKLLKKYPSVRSISTNGYTVSLRFQKITKKISVPKQPQPQKKEIECSPIIPKIKDLKTEYIKRMEINKEKHHHNDKTYRIPMSFDVKEYKADQSFLDNFDLGGGDPGNDFMLDISMKNGIHLNIHKNYYNNIAHIIRNKMLMDREIFKSEMNHIYSELALENIKTTDIRDYMSYVKVIRKNWNKIWEFSTKPQIFSLKFDSYIYKSKAISRIAKEIVGGLKDDKNIKDRHANYFDPIMFEENKEKVIMLSIGTGNGSGTISNTKGSGPKGPVKRLIKELAKYCVVVEVPEYNTSQLCSECDEFTTDVYGYKIPSENGRKKKDQNKMEKEVEKKEIGITIKATHRGRRTKEMLRDALGENGIKLDKKKIDRLKKDIKEYDKMAKKYNYYGKLYRLRRCAAKHYHNDRCILWERNKNASMNMIKMLENLLLRGTMGHFMKKRKKSG
ncbi:MAG: hypothetical protein Hyperionvirus29_5 [Hyperionvirus sp.]|uniref:Uncharacterized protein n=1 Tax=Hyperionvirus sp. TaxID=2487770 RepID=A0A3G5ABN5_9VIRU|nr:MAG: hypothetical protein Hyperionvirus29_5 [Hyperionvirus sp.]